jgi:formylglycine-generating enzyme required for sulfatase activity
MEQMMGKATKLSDIYSLGATCIRLMTGIFPKSLTLGDIQDELYDSHNFRWLWREKLLEKGIIISKKLDQILDKMLENYPQNRYQSVKEIITALNPPQPVTIPPTVIQQNNPPSGLKTFHFEVVTVNSQGDIIKKENKQAQYITEKLPNGVTMDLVFIPGGTFIMGSPNSEAESSDDERPQHSVTVPDFYMGKYTVTQAQWEAVMGNNPSKFKNGGNFPVETVSWDQCVTFCNKLSQIVGKEVTLPSEAQWEYACRAGTKTPFHYGETITPDLVNYDGNYTYASGRKGIYRQKTTAVGSFPPNNFGLYDMHGNVWEWCSDTWHENYNNAPVNGSAWIDENDSQYRLLRGGGWNFNPIGCRSAYRGRNASDDRYYGFGFRVVSA